MAGCRYDVGRVYAVIDIGELDEIYLVRFNLGQIVRRATPHEEMECIDYKAEIGLRKPLHQAQADAIV